MKNKYFWLSMGGYAASLFFMYAWDVLPEETRLKSFFFVLAIAFIAVGAIAAGILNSGSREEKLSEVEYQVLHQMIFERKRQLETLEHQESEKNE